MSAGITLAIAVVLPLVISGCSPSKPPSPSIVTHSDAETAPADCAVRTEWLNETSGVLKIDASECRSSDLFPKALDSALRKVDTSKIQRLALVGPGSPENKAAMVGAWVQACKAHSGRGEEVRNEALLSHYRESSAPAVIAENLKAKGTSLELTGLDNIYPLRPRERPASGPCDADVPLPTLWFARSVNRP